MDKAQAIFNAVSFKGLVEQYKKTIGFEWHIYKGKIEDRYRRVQGTYEDSFREQFKADSKSKFKGCDIITYLDSLSLMKMLHEYISDLASLDIFMEFQIPYAQMKRIDYLIAFKTTIVLLEFALYDTKENTRKYLDVYHKKLTQVMQYEKLLQNLISAKFKTIPYVVLYSPDVDDKRNNIKNKNTEKMKELSNLIRTLYEKDRSATDELILLSK